jgi:hypothetical protein
MITASDRIIRPTCPLLMPTAREAQLPDALVAQTWQTWGWGL